MGRDVKNIFVGFLLFMYRKYCEMIRHFFLDKTNSIVESSQQNMGLNPVLYLGYGKRIMRGLIHFDVKKIKELMDDKTFANLDKLSFTLKMTNCFSIDGLPYEKTLFNNFDSATKRASSFDLILFKLPREFDEGRGFDFESDFWVKNKSSKNNEGSNWYFAKNGIPWSEEDSPISEDGELVLPNIFDKGVFIKVYDKLVEYSKRIETESDITCEEILEDISSIKENNRIDEKSLKGGIYTSDFIRSEYDKFINGKDSIIVAEQHFDFGDEELSMDITKYVFDAVGTGKNNGLCLAFAPNFEEQDCEERYVGFVDDNTNTFFHPYVEAKYDEYISDDRESFALGKTNKLYLYTFENGNPINLDKVPTCSVEETSVDVKQVTKGVYCAEIKASKDEMDTDAIYYDKWSGIALNGEEEDDIELEFVAKPKTSKVFIGSDSDVKRNMIPSVYGINDGEVLHRGEVREVVVDFRKEFETDKKYIIDGAEFRLYAKDGNREITVINYQPIEKAFLNNFFMVYTEDLIPNKYYVDIKVAVGREIKYFRNILNFKVVSDVTERYE